MKQTNDNLDLCYQLRELMTDRLGIKWSIPCDDRKVATVSYSAKGHMLFAMVGEHPNRPGVYHRGWVCLRCVWDGEFYIHTGENSLRVRITPDTYRSIDDAIVVALMIEPRIRRRVLDDLITMSDSEKVKGGSVAPTITKHRRAEI